MATDNVQANPGSSGAVFRTFADSNSVEWPASVVAYVTGGSAGSWTLQQVDSSHGLPVTPQGTFNVSVNTALPAGSALIGGVELVDSSGVNKASISAAGAVKVDGSAVTQPVSGTVTANQGGSWTVTANAGTGTFTVSGTVTANVGTTNGVALDATLTGGTQKTKLIDTGGTNVASVSAGGALKVDNSAVTQPVSGTITANAGTGTFTTSDLADGSVTGGAAGTKSLLMGGIFNTAAPTLTNGQQCSAQFDSSGNLKVNIASGGGSGGTSSSFSSAFPATGTAAGASDGTNMKPLLVDASGFLKVNVAAGSSGNAAASATGSAVPVDADYAGLNVGGTLRGRTGVNPTGSVYAAQSDVSSVGGTTIALGQGTMAASFPVVIASNQSAVPVSGTITANAGTGTFTVSGTVAATQSGTWTVQPGNTANTTPWLATINQGGNSATVTASNALKVDGSAVTQPVSGTVSVNALPAGTNTIGNVVPVAATSGGATPYHLISAATTNATSVKASAGQVYSITAFNTNASARFLKFYDSATSPTVGTTAVVQTFLLPGNTSGAGMTLSLPVGMSFVNGIALAITGGISDSDTTAIGANDVAVSITYK